MEVAGLEVEPERAGETVRVGIAVAVEDGLGMLGRAGSVIANCRVAGARVDRLKDGISLQHRLLQR